ncbi:unnamed protein product [Paramecium pentaurelia]|uniref:Uncharacterized protein n=1 Tax=Paramecium pentaurelia TaxID=43138 RepID=A0A8S1XN23_9CILI|nr:unnamed protein product [Paramecium pentaurelia]
MKSNKNNLAHAKRFSVWTVKEITYLKLAQECNIPANVILIFINNDELVKKYSQLQLRLLIFINISKKLKKQLSQEDKETAKQNNNTKNTNLNIIYIIIQQNQQWKNTRNQR